MRNLAIIVVLLLWALLGWKMCTDYTQCCTTDTGSVGLADAGGPVLAAEACNLGMLCFDDDSCEPRLGDGWEAYRDSLLSQLDQEDNGSNLVLSIIGLYTSDESYNGTFDNLGACRSEAIKSLFAEADLSRIETEHNLTIGRELGIAERYGITVNTVDTQFDASISSSNVSESAVIYFPYNSTNKLNDGEIESYLRRIAQDVKDNGGKVSLVGHTDDKGRAVKNTELGQRRANIIMDYLLGQGLLRSQISSESRGESSPVANNATAVGRAKNRRVELKIIR